MKLKDAPIGSKVRLIKDRLATEYVVVGRTQNYTDPLRRTGLVILGAKTTPPGRWGSLDQWKNWDKGTNRLDLRIEDYPFITSEGFDYKVELIEAPKQETTAPGLGILLATLLGAGITAANKKRQQESVRIADEEADTRGDVDVDLSNRVLGEGIEGSDAG
jgi:hypothetical protein